MKSDHAIGERIVIDSQTNRTQIRPSFGEFCGDSKTRISSPQNIAHTGNNFLGTKEGNLTGENSGGSVRAPVNFSHQIQYQNDQGRRCNHPSQAPIASHQNMTNMGIRAPFKCIAQLGFPIAPRI